MVFNKKQHETVVGLDLSTNSIAYSVFKNGLLVEYGEYRLTGETNNRLRQSSRYAKAMGERLNPDLIVYEGAAYINNRKTVMTLASFYGAITSGMMQPHTVLRDVPAMTWQAEIGNTKLSKEEKAKIRIDTPDKSAVWYKNAEREFRKQRTIDWVAKTYNVTLDSNDVADAVGVGHYGVKKFA